MGRSEGKKLPARNAQPGIKAGAESGPRARLIASAMRLFSEKAYSSVSLDDVLEDAGAYKKSLYRYFPSKAHLGRAYLVEQGHAFVGFLERLAARQHEFLPFWKSWMRYLRREASQGRYPGCPFANFAAQTAEEVADYRPELNEVVRRWRETLALFLVKCGKGELSAPEALRMCDRLMISYEGAVALFRITGASGFLERLEEEGRVIWAARSSSAGA